MVEGMDREPWNSGRVVDLVFLIGIGLKAIDGAAELLLGVPLLFLRPAQLTEFAHSVTAGELREDPHDLIAHLVLHGAAALSTETALFTAAYLIIHGAVKVLIVIALMRNARRVYPWAILALVAFLIWQVVELVIHPSIGVACFSVFDVVVIALTWREWRQHRSLTDALHNAFPWSAGLRVRRRPGRRRADTHASRN
jgi:uncharacterized membrane protein